MRCNECDETMIAEEVEWFCPNCGNTRERALDLSDTDYDTGITDWWEMTHGEDE